MATKPEENNTFQANFKKKKTHLCTQCKNKFKNIVIIWNLFDFYIFVSLLVEASLCFETPSVYDGFPGRDLIFFNIQEI